MILLRHIGWILCVVYSTIPFFWLLIHPLARFWRSRKGSPFAVLLPVWLSMWALMATLTLRWSHKILYSSPWTWIPAMLFLLAGVRLYQAAHSRFSLRQLAGIPELRTGEKRGELAVTGVRARVRHPIYLGHLCEMLAWSLGTGLAVCWALTGLAVIAGAVMVTLEERELEARFGDTYSKYRQRVPALLPSFRVRH